MAFNINNNVITFHEEPGCTTLEMFPLPPEVDEESVTGCVSLPDSLWMLDNDTVCLVLVSWECFSFSVPGP